MDRTVLVKSAIRTSMYILFGNGGTIILRDRHENHFMIFRMEVVASLCEIESCAKDLRVGAEPKAFCCLIGCDVMVFFNLRQTNQTIYLMISFPHIIYLFFLD